MSQVTDSVIEDLKRRSEVGLSKYGVTMDRKDLAHKQWLQHLYEELLDAAQYTKKLIIEDKPKIWNAYRKAAEIRDLAGTAFRTGTIENKTYADEEFNKDALDHIGILAAQIVEDLYGEVRRS